jgi:hypothetical protein
MDAKDLIAHMDRRLRQPCVDELPGWTGYMGKNIFRFLWLRIAFAARLLYAFFQVYLATKAARARRLTQIL